MLSLDRNGSQPHEWVSGNKYFNSSLESCITSSTNQKIAGIPAINLQVPTKIS